MINHHSKTKEELIKELQELQQKLNLLEEYHNKLVSQRKNDEIVLKKNVGQLHSILESMNEGFTIQEVICDSNGKPCDLLFLDANKAFERQTGFKHTEILGHTLLELFPQSEAYWIERYGNVGLKGEAIHFEAMLGPQEIFYKVSAFQTEPGRLGVMYTEITGRMLSEQELSYAEEHAEENERLRTEIMASMSHELRTPMTGILGFAELLKEPDLTDEQQQQYISIIEKSGERVLNIINEMTDISNTEYDTAKVSPPDIGKPEGKMDFKEVALDDSAVKQVVSEVTGLKILIAEDDETSETLIAIVVKTFGKEILKVRNGVDAVEACRNNTDIDLVLMDIQMPLMDGYEATRQIRQFNKEVIIIAQTAYGLTGDREKSIDAGCNDYISKPIGKDKLKAIIQKHFE